MYSTVIQGVIFFLIDTVHNVRGNLGEECLPGHAHHKHYKHENNKKFGVISTIERNVCPGMRIVNLTS